MESAQWDGEQHQTLDVVMELLIYLFLIVKLVDLSVITVECISWWVVPELNSAKVFSSESSFLCTVPKIGAGRGVGGRLKTKEAED